MVSKIMIETCMYIIINLKMLDCDLAEYKVQLYNELCTRMSK